MELLYSFFAIASFIIAVVTLIGVALYYLDKWLDNDEMESSTARHRA